MPTRSWPLLSPRWAALPAAALVVVAVASPGLAADPAEGPIGGPLMGKRGTVVAAGAPALPTGVSAQGWLVADLDSGQVLAARDAHGRYAPASTLKTLTAVTLIPRLDPARKVVPSFDDVNVEGSKVGLVQRVGYPVSELFEALMMVSGNDAANVLASAAGGQQATAGLMNAEAHRLGALDTHAVNPSGLDAEGQVSSPYDLALIAREGMTLPAFRRYVGLRKSSVSAPGKARIETYTKNKLLRNYDGALGIKNGYTTRARASFVGAAERDGRRLLVTLMKADPRVWAEAALLLDWGFAASAAGVAPVGELVAPPSKDGDDPPAPQQATLASAREEPAPEGSGVPLVAAGAGALAVGSLVVRRRSVRRRSRYRLDLPL